MKNRSTRRRIIRGALSGVAAAATLMSLSACSADTSGSDDGTTTLTFMHRYPEDTYAPYFQGVADAFEAENPGIKVEITAIGNDTYREQLTLLTGQGKLPDVFWATPGNLESEFVKAGLAHDFTDELAEDDWGDSFDQMALASYASRDGGTFGIPLQSNYKFMAYNPSILAQADLSYPESFEDLLTTCDSLAAKGITPIAFGNAEGWPAAHYMTVLNGYFVDADTLEEDYSSVDEPGVWGDDGYVQALEAFGELDDRCFADGAETATFDTARASFLSGGAAMYAGSFGEVKLISDETDPAAFPEPWGIANIPAPSDGGGDRDSIAGAGNGVMVREGDNTDLAIEFVRFMTNEKNAEEFPSATGFVSAVSAANNSENTIAQTSAFLNDVVANASDVNMWLDNALPGKVAGTYSSALEGFLNGQLTAEQVTETLRSTKP